MWGKEVVLRGKRGNWAKVRGSYGVKGRCCVEEKRGMCFEGKILKKGENEGSFWD